MLSENNAGVYETDGIIKIEFDGNIEIALTRLIPLLSNVKRQNTEKVQVIQIGVLITDKLIKNGCISLL